MKCQVSREAASASSLARLSCRKFSPKSRTPAAAAAAIAALLWPFETARSVTESTVRPEARVAALMRSRTLLSATEQFCGPDNILITDTRDYTHRRFPRDTAWPSTSHSCLLLP